MSPDPPSKGEQRIATAEFSTPPYPPGTAVGSMFFDEYPRFYETSETSPYRYRLNLRYEAIFAQHRDIFQDARVLDIASHDGRWSFAALKTGASKVVGIEAKQDLVAKANDNFAHYGVDAERYHFIAGDIFEVLDRELADVDVVLCLGFLYHTLRYNELLRHVRDLDPRHLVIDTIVAKSRRPYVKVWVENVERQGNAVSDRYSHEGKVLSGRPSVAALQMMLGAYDFEIEQLSDWTALIRDNADFGVGDYGKGKRVTARCRSVSSR